MRMSPPLLLVEFRAVAQLHMYQYEPDFFYCIKKEAAHWGAASLDPERDMVIFS